jgi:hypothetical protein
MDFIEGQGAVSDELTSVRLAISETERPLGVKRAAKTRERAANSGEIRWRIRVKSGGVNL